MPLSPEFLQQLGQSQVWMRDTMINTLNSTLNEFFTNLRLNLEREISKQHSALAQLPQSQQPQTHNAPVPREVPTPLNLCTAGEILDLSTSSTPTTHCQTPLTDSLGGNTVQPNISQPIAQVSQPSTPSPSTPTLTTTHPDNELPPPPPKAAPLSTERRFSNISSCTGISVELIEPRQSDERLPMTLFEVKQEIEHAHTIQPIICRTVISSSASAGLLLTPKEEIPNIRQIISQEVRNISVSTASVPVISSTPNTDNTAHIANTLNVPNTLNTPPSTLKEELPLDDNDFLEETSGPCDCDECLQAAIHESEMYFMEENGDVSNQVNDDDNAEPVAMEDESSNEAQFELPPEQPNANVEQIEVVPSVEPPSVELNCNHELSVAPEIDSEMDQNESVSMPEQSVNFTVKRSNGEVIDIGNEISKTAPCERERVPIESEPSAIEPPHPLSHSLLLARTFSIETSANSAFERVIPSSPRVNLPPRPEAEANFQLIARNLSFPVINASNTEVTTTTTTATDSVPTSTATLIDAPHSPLIQPKPVEPLVPVSDPSPVITRSPTPTNEVTLPPAITDATSESPVDELNSQSRNQSNSESLSKKTVISTEITSETIDVIANKATASAKVISVLDSSLIQSTLIQEPKSVSVPKPVQQPKPLQDPKPINSKLKPTKRKSSVSESTTKNREHSKLPSVGSQSKGESQSEPSSGSSSRKASSSKKVITALTPPSPARSQLSPPAESPKETSSRSTTKAPIPVPSQSLPTPPTSPVIVGQPKKATEPMGKTKERPEKAKNARESTSESKSKSKSTTLEKPRSTNDSKSKSITTPKSSLTTDRKSKSSSDSKSKSSSDPKPKSSDLKPKPTSSSKAKLTKITKLKSKSTLKLKLPSIPTTSPKKSQPSAKSPETPPSPVKSSSKVSPKVKSTVTGSISLPMTATPPTRKEEATSNSKAELTVAKRPLVTNEDKVGTTGCPPEFKRQRTNSADSENQNDTWFSHDDICILEMKCHENGCDFFFTSKSKHEQHMLDAHNRLPIICPVLQCRASFKSKQIWLNHFSVAHQNTPNKRWTCRLCPKRHSSSWSLWGHYFTCHEKGIFRCSSCSFRDSFRSTVINHHQQTHTGEPNDPNIRVIQLHCPVKCPYKTPSQVELNGHLFSEHNILRYQCRCDLNCTASFTTYTLLIKHVEQEHMTASDPHYVCSYGNGTCLAKFSEYDELEAHYLEYHQKGQFKCFFRAEKCFFQASIRAAVNWHAVSDHPIQPKQQKFKNPRLYHWEEISRKVRVMSLSCETCDAPLSCDRHLGEHNLLVHGFRRFQCRADHCGKTFDEMKGLEEHLNETHRQVLWQCNLCEPSERIATHNGLYNHHLIVHQVGDFRCSAEGCTFRRRTRQKVLQHFDEEHEETITSPTAFKENVNNVSEADPEYTRNYQMNGQCMPLQRIPGSGYQGPPQEQQAQRQCLLPPPVSFMGHPIEVLQPQFFPPYNGNFCQEQRTMDQPPWDMNPNRPRW